MFAKTEFPKQYKLLQHGLGLLLSYANRMDDSLLDRIAARHSSSGLLATVRSLDPRYTPEVEQAWREALEPGLAFMQSRY
jgi:hypothetical protein